jgi:RecB family exonuclease
MSPHTLWDEICNVTTDISIYSCRCDELCVDGNWQLAGRKATLQRAVRTMPLALTGVGAEYKITANSFPDPKRLSYSQMNTLISCPLKWALQYHARLKPSETLDIPTGNRMIGNLCHRIVNEIYSPGEESVPKRGINPDEAAARAGILYDELLPSMASELMLDGREIENRRMRKAVVYAIRQLADSITRLGLSVSHSEQLLEVNMGDIPFVGYVDLILKDLSGNVFILDMKWANSSRYKKEEVEEGRSVQLATYAWLLRSIKPEASVHAGYFMLAQGELLSDSFMLGDDALSSTRSPDEIWKLTEDAWNKDLATLNAGVIKARGVEESIMLSREKKLKLDDLRKRMKEDYASRELMYEAPSCAFCDFASLCGLADVIVRQS